MKKELPLPTHMDKYTRNRRLYETLLGMGLICDPIFADEDCDRIEALYVSAGEFSVSRQVSSPLKGSKIIDIVGTPRSYRSDVIDFPPVL